MIKNKNLKKYKNNKLKEVFLNKETEYKLISKWQIEKDKEALGRLLKAFNNFIKSIANRYLKYGLNQEDLIQEGSTGLIHAVERFDHSKDFRLSTYAQWWIKAKIQNFVLQNWSIVKSGTTMSQKTLFFGLNKLKKQINFDSHNFMGQDEVNAISKMLGIKAIQIQNMESKLAMGDQSLNQKISEENDFELLSY